MKTNYLEVVERLNDILRNKYGETGYSFNFTTNGDESFIQFGDKLIWHNDYDERVWNRELGCFEESLLEYCKNKFNNYIKELSKLKL
jgi:hypothetical protein